MWSLNHVLVSGFSVNSLSLAITPSTMPGTHARFKLWDCRLPCSYGVYHTACKGKQLIYTCKRASSDHKPHHHHSLYISWNVATKAGNDFLTALTHRSLASHLVSVLLECQPISRLSRWILEHLPQCSKHSFNLTVLVCSINRSKLKLGAATVNV